MACPGWCAGSGLAKGFSPSPPELTARSKGGREREGVLCRECRAVSCICRQALRVAAPKRRVRSAVSGAARPGNQANARVPASSGPNHVIQPATLVQRRRYKTGESSQLISVPLPHVFPLPPNSNQAATAECVSGAGAAWKTSSTGDTTPARIERPYVYGVGCRRVTLQQCVTVVLA